MAGQTSSASIAETPLESILALNGMYELHEELQESSPLVGTLKSRAGGYLEALANLSINELSSYKKSIDERNAKLPNFKRYNGIMEFYTGFGTIEGTLNALERWQALKTENIPKDILVQALENSLKVIQNYITLSGRGIHEKADELVKSYTELSRSHYNLTMQKQKGE